MVPIRPGPRKYIYDPVHGSISLTGPTLELLSHPLLQRLWGIRQTGLAHLVFPGANHTRLEHSLGVLWVARAMATGLGLSPQEAVPLEVAGLLHDLGHTPFSHTLEPVLEEVEGKSHEQVTSDLLRGELPLPFERFQRGITSAPRPRSVPEVLERHGLSVRETVDLLRARRPSSRPFRSEMLHGSVDADRLDYLQRDAHYTGVAHGFIDANRLLETLRRDRGHLVFAEKGRPAVEGFLFARSLMYSSVYYNKTVRIAEVMLQSAVERLPEFPNVAPLLALTDGGLMGALENAGGRAAEIARRFELRQLYKRAWTLSWEEGTSRGRTLRRLGRDPAARRAVEDDLAEILDGPPGSALLDLANTHRGARGPLSTPSAPRDPLWIWDGGKVVDLLREGSTWAALVDRPITPWAVGLYVPPALLGRARARRRRLLSLLD
ncbi:MAG: HD domain-containing protein [Euryarchaeota archaeon]|nr:HD domain-containing protein [Euryarchaeota archaeon]MDE1835323.1 HD domain-containing protein [Euryarchaeota archaeon]MDE1880594.1 HD domain-containing protein [Euryarchaeota archaeon]MDE2043619.1 HD domain-containing protein [Thermoplasmata archaeon]